MPYAKPFYKQRQICKNHVYYSYRAQLFRKGDTMPAFDNLKENITAFFEADNLLYLGGIILIGAVVFVLVMAMVEDN